MHRARANSSGLIAILLLTVCAAPAPADILRVKAGASGASTGATWADAFSDLQPALLAAQPGDEIWVAAGRYRPGPPGDRNVRFQLKSGVALRGGFAGVESHVNQRNLSANPTILTGDLLGDDAPGFANMTENAYQVVVAQDVDDTAILDGFIVTAGRSDGAALGPTPLSRDQGSGANVYDATPQFLNCTFLSNWSINHGAINDHGSSTVINCAFVDNFSVSHGAGLYVHHHSETFVWNCIFRGNVTLGRGAGGYSASEHGSLWIGCLFEDNRAYNGGGFYADASHVMLFGCQFTGNFAEIGGGGVFTHFGEPMVLGCYFQGNHAGVEIVAGSGGDGGSGGAGVWTEGGAAMIGGCIFTGNRSSFGGGFYAVEEAAATVEDCHFEDNHALEGGGGYSIGAPVAFRGCTFRGNTALGGSFSVGGGASTYFSDVLIDDCIFDGNTAELGGGGQYLEGSNPIVTNCTYVGNHAIGDTEGWGGGLLCSFDAHPQIYNSVFNENTARAGGGLFLTAFSFSTISNCTFTANTAVGQSGMFGGAIQNMEFAESLLSNSIVRGNLPDQVGGAPLEIDYCNVEGGLAGIGIIDADPLFRDPLGVDGIRGTADDDLRLSAGSPCIDVGANTRMPDWLQHDRAGGPRFWNDPEVDDGGTGTAPIIDLGAFESRSSDGIAGDLNCDQVVSPVDLAQFVAALMNPVGYSLSHPECPAGRADINGDGRVNGQDVAAMAHILTGG